MRDSLGPESTRCKGPTFQSHQLPLSCRPITCRKWAVGQNAGRAEGQKIEYMHAHNVCESISDSCGYKNSHTTSETAITSTRIS